MKWGYKRLSKVAKSIVENFSYDDVDLDALFHKTVSKHSSFT